MKKIGAKISLKNKQKKLKIALKARKIRKNNKKKKQIAMPQKDNLIIFKKNLLPAIALVLGCFFFYLGNFAPVSIFTQSAAEAKIIEPVITANKTSVNSTDIHLLPPTPTISAEEQAELDKKAELREQIMKLVQDKPMEAMVDDIIERDRAVAAYLLGIGMKESKYGIYSPKKDGRDCYNYWGYRGKENQTKSGYSCFDSPEHAVQVVGDRIEAFIKNGRKTPEAMVVWKCGYSCNGHSAESVAKWIADVSINYYKLNPENLLTKK